jgi:branched-chain amino acid transport system permease protein
MMIRAATSNREMAASLGVNIPLLFALVFAFGVALAAFAGTISAPIASVSPGMGNHMVIICFVVVVIGGIGSINGAMIAALAIGLADTLGKVTAPEYSAFAVYLLMAVILLWRPQGIAGRA